MSDARKHTQARRTCTRPPFTTYLSHTLSPYPLFRSTGLFNPQGFLTANRQEVCRKHNKEGWALDDVVNLTKVVNMEREEVRKGPDEGVYIYGLFLDGCRWDKPGNKLADAVPKVLFAPLPVLLITGILQSERKLDAYSYSAPCYKSKACVRRPAPPRDRRLPL